MNSISATTKSSQLSDLLINLRDFLKKEIIPHEQKWLKIPWREAEKEIRTKRDFLKEMGAWNPYLSRNHGGPGYTLTQVAQISEVLGGSYFGHFACNCQAPDAGNIELLLQYARDEHKEKYLFPLLNGDIRSCFSMTEPENAGSNPTLLNTLALKEKDYYLINGRKWFTTSADGASFAIVMAVTHPAAENPYQRASMLLVPTNAPGFQLVRNIPVMGHAGTGWASHSEIIYENVKVPENDLIGPENQGFTLAQERLGPGRIHHCMRWIGICERAFDLMCRRAASRKMGATSFLGEKQMVQEMIAESRAEIDAARLMVLHAAEKMDALGQKNAALEISTIKFFVAGILHKVLDRAIQIHGAQGVTDDTILALYYRE
jgi:alkylation response protein AidB-like acyl-CoA dehydrogenase